MKKIIISITLIGGVLAVALNHEKIRAVAAERYQDLQLFAKVLNLVQQYYVEEVDTKKLIYGGIKGMLRELDPHTNFLPPDVFTEFESETSGEFGGLGIEITIQDGVLTVISPIEDTPAWKAGIKAGDKVVEINGESTKGLSLAEAALRMKGKLGTKVRMGIFREGFDKPKEFVVERGTVKIKSVKYTDLEDGYAYVRLTSFIENSSKDLDKVLTAHEKKTPTKGLVLDLRRNPGGLLEQAIQISDMFLDSGVIVSTIGRNKKEKEVVYAKKPGTRPPFPIIVLIDEYSASASEILSGALQDNHRALIMGQRSFGKGSVQSVVKLGDGSGLKLTVARYYTPKGRSIQAEGIVPDVALDDTLADEVRKAGGNGTTKKGARREKDIEGHLLSDNEKKEMQQKKDAGDTSSFWWIADKSKDEKLTAREKLLKDDFEVLQAYNYLRAWKVMQEFDKKGPVPESEAPAASEEKAPEKTSEKAPSEKPSTDKPAAEKPSAEKPPKETKATKPTKETVPTKEAAPTKETKAPAKKAKPAAPKPKPEAK